MATLPRTTATPLALTWNDTGQAALSLPTGGTAPSLTAFSSGWNTQGPAYNVNDLLYFGFQLNHNAAVGSDCKLHLHFMFPSNPTAGRTVRFECYYTVAQVNQAFSAESGPHYAEYTIPATDGVKHRVIDLIGFALPALPQSAWVAGRVRRVASTGTESNVSPILGFVDGHYQQGPYGTMGEFI